MMVSGEFGMNHFLQYVNNTTSKLKEPFFSTYFSLSSHEPFYVPDEYKGVFSNG